MEAAPKVMLHGYGLFIQVLFSMFLFGVTVGRGKATEIVFLSWANLASGLRWKRKGKGGVITLSQVCIEIEQQPMNR